MVHNMETNINIKNKLAFFDFDRTLVAHDYSQDYKMTDDYFMQCVYMLTSLEKEHANDRPLPCMQWYARKLFHEGYKLYCLTHEIFNLRDQLKQDQLKQFYPDTPMTYITVNEAGHKLEMMTAVAMTECCELSNVIFVDDRIDTIKSVMAAGIDAKHLSDIVVMYESEKISQEQTMYMKPNGFDIGPVNMGDGM